MTARELIVANFNLHAGVDGWGRPFDYIAAAKSIDADVLMLEEVFGAEGKASQAQQIAEELGYSVLESPLGRLIVKEPDAAHLQKRSWGPRPMVRGIFSAVVPEPRSSARAKPTARLGRERGTISIAVLSRIEVSRSEVIDLPRLSRDKLTRRALVLEIGGAKPLRIVGTHLGHLSHGSPRQMLMLRRYLSHARPAVVLGDMNCWGPPLAAILGAKRAVKGKTWPAWRPHSQIDHVLTLGEVGVSQAEVLPALGSDHRPIRAQISWE